MCFWIFINKDELVQYCPWLSEIVGLCPNPILLHAPLFNDLVVPIDLLVYGYPSVGKYVDLGEDKRKFTYKDLKKLIQP